MERPKLKLFSSTLSIEMDSGNGKIIYFCMDIWLKSDPLCMRALCPLTNEMKQAKVRDYWTEYCGWRWDELGLLLPATTLLKHASVIINSAYEDEDRLGWMGTNSENFSVSSEYKIETKG